MTEISASAVFKDDYVSVVQSAIRRTATAIEISDVDFTPVEELYNEIKTTDPITFRLLKDFLDEYSKWFEVKQTETSSVDYLNATTSKDNARTVLVDHINNNLPCR